MQNMRQGRNFMFKSENKSIEIRKNMRDEAFKKNRFQLENENDDGIPSMPDAKLLQIDPQQHKKQIMSFIIDDTMREELYAMNTANYQPEMLMNLVRDVFTDDPFKMHRGTVGIRKLLSKMQEPPIQKCIDLGMVARLIQFIEQSKYVQLKFEAAWCLSNVAASQSSFCKILYEKGAIKAFIDLLKSNQKQIRDQAIWGVGNLAADKIQYRDQFIKLGGLRLINDIVNNSNSRKTVKNGCWAISNLCRGFPNPLFSAIKQAIPTLCGAVQRGFISENGFILSDIYWTIAFMVEGGKKQKINCILQTGCLNIILNHTRSKQKQVCLSSLRIIGNISQGNQSQVQKLLENNFLLNCEQCLLQHSIKEVRKQTCWILSNLAGGSCEQVQYFLKHQNLINIILHIFETDQMKIRKQCCWIFRNLTHLGQRQAILEFLHSKQIIRYYVNMMDSQDIDILDHLICCLDQLLEFGENHKINNKNIILVALENYGGAIKLQKLQNHPNQKIYEKASKVCQRFSEFYNSDTAMID